MDEVMSQQRKKELELYKLYAIDERFYRAFFDTMKRLIDNPRLGRRWGLIFCVFVALDLFYL